MYTNILVVKGKLLSSLMRFLLSLCSKYLEVDKSNCRYSDNGEAKKILKTHESSPQKRSFKLRPALSQEPSAFSDLLRVMKLHIGISLASSAICIG